MIEKQGIPISQGISIGQVFIYERDRMVVSKYKVKNIDSEIERLDKALENSVEELDDLYNKSFDYIGKSESEIFLVHKTIIEDPKFKERIIRIIYEENINSEWALDRVIDDYIKIFKDVENKYLQEKIIDMEDIHSRILKKLYNIASSNDLNIPSNSIVLAKELTPSELMELNKYNIQGLLLEKGSLTSHTAIISKTLGIPVIINIKDLFKSIDFKDEIIIDAYSGNIVIKPDIASKEKYLDVKMKEKEIYLSAKKYKGKESITKDGSKIEVSGNITSVEDAKEILQNGGDGIGLFRTEFLYINRENPPSELEQIKIYSEIGELFSQSKINIRTADIGGDKGVPYLKLSPEQNPFLGYRGVRLSLDHKDMFKTQIRAILRSNKYGNFRILFPMISSISELEKVLNIIDEVKLDLKRENISFNENIELGIVVETPAVILQAESFIKRVDFVSIGTNDLIQYTVAVDRDNLVVSDLYNPYHPSILKSISIVINVCKKYNKELSVCGEVGSDEKLIPILLAMGIRQVSIVPNKILYIKKLIRSIDIKWVEKELDEILDLEKVEDVEQRLEKIYNKISENN